MAVSSQSQFTNSAELPSRNIHPHDCTTGNTKRHGPTRTRPSCQIRGMVFKFAILSTNKNFSARRTAHQRYSRSPIATDYVMRFNPASPSDPHKSGLDTNHPQSTRKKVLRAQRWHPSLVALSQTHDVAVLRRFERNGKVGSLRVSGRSAVAWSRRCFASGGSVGQEWTAGAAEGRSTQARSHSPGESGLAVDGRGRCVIRPFPLCGQLAVGLASLRCDLHELFCRSSFGKGVPGLEVGS